MERIEYPESWRMDLLDLLHGVEVPDPYRWLEEIDSEESQRWISAQNRLTFDYLGRIPAREKLFQRLTELWDYERYGVPSKRGGRTFYICNDGLQDQGVLYWMASVFVNQKQASAEAEPKVLLDPNGLSEDGTVALMDWEVSEDGQLLAYGLAAAGSDWQEWRVRVVETGRDLDDLLTWVKFSGVSWTPDGRGFFYSRYDAPAEGMAYKGANYYQKLYLHRIGAPQDEDELIYGRPDEKEWSFDGWVTDDGRYLAISVGRGTTRENGFFFKELAAGSGQVVELLSDFDARYTFVGNDGPLFYFFTDLDAPMSRVIGIDTTRPERENWVDVIPESADALQAVTLVGGRFVAVTMHDAHSRVAIFGADGEPLRELGLPGMGAVEGFWGKWDDPETFYRFTGFTTPGTIYQLDVVTGENRVFREPQLGFDPDQYVTEQVFFPSKDGTLVPMFISHRQGLALDGDNLTYLYGYGGFNLPQPPTFSVSNLVWMEMGGVYAQANLRGGSEYGESWHQGGMKLEKQNVFDDMIAAAEWLIENAYTRTERLAIGGRSNGGLLTGACLTQRPELFGAVLVIVGVLDMLRFQKFTIGWAWTSDYGSPDDLGEFQALLAYSPYHQLRPGTAYPPTLVTTGDHDDRVFPAHSFKFAAALQAAQAGAAPTLIRIDTRAGHGLGKPTSKLIEEWADCWAFLVDALQGHYP